jgi:alkane 1-monooxygenase
MIWRYAIATLIPVGLLALAAVFGGPFAAVALIWLTLLSAVLDQVIPQPVPNQATDAGARAADRLSAVLAIGHLLLIPLVLTAFIDPTQSFGQKLLLFLATASFFGQVSHPGAHELIHRKSTWLKSLGALVYTSFLFGHHVSAHRLVHHRYVGTPNDPNTPQTGEAFWPYVLRAWHGSFMAGWTQEGQRLQRRKRTIWSPTNPYLVWVGGGFGMLIVAIQIAGFVGLISFVALAVMTQLQILLSDYIQHYGLSRRTLPNGRIEPIGPQHSWNAPKGFSSLLMMNAPSHSDHHMHPDRPYDTLETLSNAPILPYSLPIMAVIATIPQLWHRVMDRRAAKVMAAQAMLDVSDSDSAAVGAALAQ